MKSRVLIILAAVFLCHNTRAQETFFNFIEGWRSVYSEEREDFYFISGLNSFDPFVVGDNYVQYTELDLGGSEVSSNDFFIDTTDYVNFGTTYESIVSGDSLLYIASWTGFLDGNSSVGTLLRFNKNTYQTELLNSYGSELESQLYSLAVKNDTSLILAGQYSDNAGTSFLALYETDLQGEPRWTYTTECGNNCFNYAEHILPLDNGNTVLLYREWDYEIGNQDKERAVLVMIDPEGIELWRAYPGNDEDYKILPGGVILQDDQLLVCFTDPYVYADNGDWVGNLDVSVYFESYELSGELAGSFDFVGQIPDGNAESAPVVLYDMTQMQVLDDGNILLSGYSRFRGHLIRLTPSGEIIWFREFTPFPLQLDNPNFYEYTRILHTLPTSDGGFLCTGTYRSDPREEYPQGIQTAFALKVDEYGCLEEGCEITSVEELSISLSSPIKVWPNPVTGNSFNITSQLDLHIASIELIDVQGRKISLAVAGVKLLDSGTITSLSPSHTIPSGLYTLLITTSEGVAYSLKLVFEE